MRLSNDGLASLAARAASEVVVPSYDRARLAPGIVHLGLGAFHRAHQAVYTEHTLRAGDHRWGIVGVSLRRADTSEALAPQDHLYAVDVRDGTADSFQVVGALIASLVAPQSPAAVLDAMTDPRCHIVSLTITEKGYCHNPASGVLQFDHPDIAHDLREAAAPRSAIGFVVRALALRRAAGWRPFTVLSCDNLPSNGDTMRALTLAFAREADPAAGRLDRARGRVSQHDGGSDRAAHHRRRSHARSEATRCRRCVAGDDRAVLAMGDRGPLRGAAAGVGACRRDARR